MRGKGSDSDKSSISFYDYLKRKIKPPKQYCSLCGDFIGNIWSDKDNAICTKCYRKRKLNSLVRIFKYGAIWVSIITVSFIYLLQNDHTPLEINFGKFGRTIINRSESKENTSDNSNNYSRSDNYGPNDKINTNETKKSNSNSGYSFGSNKNGDKDKHTKNEKVLAKDTNDYQCDLNDLEINNDSIQKKLIDIYKRLDEGSLTGNEEKDLDELKIQAQNLSIELKTKCVLDEN